MPLPLALLSHLPLPLPMALALPLPLNLPLPLALPSPLPSPLPLPLPRKGAFFRTARQPHEKSCPGPTLTKMCNTPPPSAGGLANGCVLRGPCITRNSLACNQPSTAQKDPCVPQPGLGCAGPFGTAQYVPPIVHGILWASIKSADKGMVVWARA